MLLAFKLQLQNLNNCLTASTWWPTGTPVTYLIPLVPQLGSSNRQRIWNQGAPNCYRQPWYSIWHKMMNIFLPGQVATAEILLERSQNPNRSGKSLASIVLGNSFSLCLFWALPFPVAGPFLEECSLSHQMTCSLKRVLWEQSREASESNNLVISQLFPILLTPLS